MTSATQTKPSISRRNSAKIVATLIEKLDKCQEWGDLNAMKNDIIKHWKQLDKHYKCQVDSPEELFEAMNDKVYTQMDTSYLENIYDTTTVTVPSVTVEVSKKPVKASLKSELPISTPEHLNPIVADSTIPSNWKEMQSLAKQWGIKAGGKGVTSSSLNHALTEYKRLGASEFAIRYPEMIGKKSSTVKKSSDDKAIVLPEELRGLSFREAQAYVKQYRESQIKRGHKAKFQDYIKNGVNIGGELRDCKGTSWDGLVNQLVAISRYVETKM